MRWSQLRYVTGDLPCIDSGALAYYYFVSIQVFTGASPFSNPASFATALAIVEGKRPQQPTHPTFTEDLWALVRRCWDQDPRLRPEVPEVLNVLRSLSGSHPFLQQLRRLDSSLSGFHDQLTKVLYGEDYQQHAPNLQSDDLVWLIDYLDKVCRHITSPFPTRCSTCRRPSMVSILPVPLPGSACANSEAYVALE